MDAYRLSLKLYFEPAAAPELAAYIPIFHRWISERVLDHLLIDVADYSQIPDGPGILLIAHEGHTSIDATDGRPGLVYARKRPQTGTFGERLRATWQQLSTTARLLESEPSLASSPSLASDRLTVRIHDRLLAPNTTETLAAVTPELRRFSSEIFGDTRVELEYEADPRDCFGVQMRADTRGA